jgi:hypothetical protein
MKMKRKTIFTTVLLLVTLYAPLSLFGQDFEMDGTVLVRYRGSETNVTIPEGVTAIGNGAFSYTDMVYANNNVMPLSVFLTSITIPSSVTSIGEETFLDCFSLASITVDNQNSWYSSVDGVLFNKNRTVLIKYPARKRKKNILSLQELPLLRIGHLICVFILPT